MTHRHSLPMWAALLGSGLAGAFVALQSRITGGLSQQIGDGYLAALISFGVGLALVAAVVLCSRTARGGLGLIRAELRSGRLPWWTLLGGACGAFFVLGQGLVAPVLGLALFTVGVVAGQVLGGLLLDRVGLGPGGRVDPTPQRVAGTVLAIVAVILSVLADLGGDGSGAVRGAGQLWLVVLPFAAGALVAWQAAVNGLLRAAAHSAMAATLISFAVGTAVLVVAAGASIGVNGLPTRWPDDPLLYLGGLIGVVFIAVSTLLVRAAGVLLLSMSNVAGQLLAAVAFEAGLPLAGGVTPWLLGGTAVALLAVVIAALPGRSR